MKAHPRTASFDQAVDVYEEARPEYPGEAVAWLVERLDLRPGRTVLDLGAGTGKLTRRLVGTGARVIAVEPLPAMRARLVELVPEAEALDGAAEQIPLVDASVDAITVGQAFHWFRLDEALPELHRVLRPGGLLAAAWNVRAPGPVQDALFEILRTVHGATPAHVDSAWREQVESSELFGRFEAREFGWEEVVELERVVRRVLSISFVAALPRERQDEVAAQVRDALSGLPRPLRYPLRTEVLISVRQDEAR